MANSVYFAYQKEERKHAVPCISMGRVCIVSDSENKICAALSTNSHLVRWLLNKT